MSSSKSGGRKRAVFSAWFAKLQVLWRKLFFWQAPSEGSGEFKPEPHHDHALVLSVTATKSIPRWRQLRFMMRVLDPRERRLLWISTAVFALALAIGGTLLIRPHLVTVPASGGTLTEALVGSPKLINPVFLSKNDADRDLAALIYSGLFRLNDQMEPQPDLAGSYRWIDDDKTLEAVIRKDARFHDGTPVTSDDVVFTIQAIKNPNWRSPLAGVFRSVKVVRVDDATVQFQLEAPDPLFLSELTLGILPAHVWEDVSDTTAHLAEANIKPVGSGPYQVQSFTRDNKGAISVYTLRRFPHYYGIQPLIERRRFHFYPDRDQGEQAFQSNQVDALALEPWADADRLHNASVRAATLELPQETVALFNVKDPVLKDERVRRALDLALDRQELQELVGPHTRLVTSPFPFLDATGTIADLEQARTLLTQANWVLKEGETIRTWSPPAPAARTTARGTNRASAPPPQVSASSTQLTLTIDVPDQPDLLKVADLLKRRWSLLGVKVDVRTSDLRDVVGSQSYQILVWNILPPVSQDLSLFWSSEKTGANGLNLSNLADRDVDAALASFRSAKTADELAAARVRVSNAILARTPALFLMRPTYAYLVSTNVQGVTDLRIARPSDRLLQAMRWYVKTKWGWR